MMKFAKNKMFRGDMVLTTESPRSDYENVCSLCTACVATIMRTLINTYVHTCVHARGVNTHACNQTCRHMHSTQRRALTGIGVHMHIQSYIDTRTHVTQVGYTP